jgi:hypothetical protein
MVGVAQLVERWLVEPDVAGSSPVVHPTRFVRTEERPEILGPFFFAFTATDLRPAQTS